MIIADLSKIAGALTPPGGAPRISWRRLAHSSDQLLHGYVTLEPMAVRFPGTIRSRKRSTS